MLPFLWTERIEWINSFIFIYVRAYLCRSRLCAGSPSIGNRLFFLLLISQGLRAAPNTLQLGFTLIIWPLFSLRTTLASFTQTSHDSLSPAESHAHQLRGSACSPVHPAPVHCIPTSALRQQVASTRIN